MSYRNLVLITLDAVRPDHLSCYGYDVIQTKKIDFIAKEGVTFETCISSSCLTPVSLATILSGLYPPNHGFQDPFCTLEVDSLAEKCKRAGFATAGFVGVSFLSATHGFGKGFDLFDEPTEEGSWHTKKYQKEDKGMLTIWGNQWAERMFTWISEHKSQSFFAWGHWFECHLGAEEWMLEKGILQEGVLSKDSYYDAKIKYMDEYLFGTLIKVLRDEGIWENTDIMIVSDHGETLGEHRLMGSIPKYGLEKHPQHRSMYDTDLKTPLVIKSNKLSGRFSHPVRTVDVTPTAVDLLGLKEKDISYDGQSLVPFVTGQKPYETPPAYAEERFKERGEGKLQAIRWDNYKLIRNITTGQIEFYNLVNDPGEQKNLYPKALKGALRSEIEKSIKILDRFLVKKESLSRISKDEKKILEERLRALGYID